MMWRTMYGMVGDHGIPRTHGDQGNNISPNLRPIENIQPLSVELARMRTKKIPKHAHRSRIKVASMYVYSMYVQVATQSVMVPGG